MAGNLKGSRITVKTLMKKCTLLYFIIGVIIGVIMLLYSFSNSDFKWNIADNAYYGVTAGLFALLFMPFCYGGSRIFSLIYALVSNGMGL